MEDNNRNLILATVLSFLVILVWYTVFAPEPPLPTEQPVAVETQTQDVPLANPESSTLPADLGAAAPAAPEAGRVEIQTPSLSGSISLAGGRIDDLLLTKYRETLDEDSPNVRLLSPSSATATDAIQTGASKPYYAVYGWTPGPGVDPALVPGPSTVWTVESGDTLAPGQPVTLAWDNGAGQIFRRTFSVDENYLFTVSHALQNNGDAAFTAAPYGIIARHGRPDTQNFFILHEGVVHGVAHQHSAHRHGYDNERVLRLRAGQNRRKIIGDVKALLYCSAGARSGVVISKNGVFISG